MNNRIASWPILVCIFVASLLPVPRLHAEEAIGLFFDEECGSCSAQLNAGEQTTLFIRAVRGGPTGSYPLTQAEFRVVGMPGDWSVSCVPNLLANVVIGDPFGGGTDIAFGAGIEGTCVELFTCTVTASSSDLVRLAIVAHTTNPQFPGNCPFIRCNQPPVICAVCVPRGEAIINGPECTVATLPSTWTGIKRLYKH